LGIVSGGGVALARVIDVIGGNGTDRLIFGIWSSNSVSIGATPMLLLIISTTHISKVRLPIARWISCLAPLLGSP
jgi:hypothetical protein